tara:strand:- start:21693 stop:22454 length:762 start_codon:yes stop_codon:yes gene_type:complete
MSYTTNINQIDNELKKVFSDVIIDNSDFRQLNIKLSNPINENTNNSLEMRLFVSQTNLNDVDPILEWGYYTDPTELDNLIKFKSKAYSLPITIKSVIENNRLNERYLSSIEKVELINEDTDTIDITIDHINQTYELSENRLNLNVSKFKKYLENVHGLIIDNGDIILEHRDVNSGRVRKPSFTGSNEAMIGDESEVTLAGVSSLNLNGNITPTDWLTLETAIRKIPFVEDINSSTYNYSCTFNFSTKVFVELV